MSKRSSRGPRPILPDEAVGIVRDARLGNRKQRRAAFSRMSADARAEVHRPRPVYKKRKAVKR